MSTPPVPRFLAFLTFAPADELDASWMMDAVDGAARRLALPEIVGLEGRDALVALDGDDRSDTVGAAIFLVVLLSRRGAESRRVEDRIRRFLARPTQIRAQEYLIPVVIPGDGEPTALEDVRWPQGWLPELAPQWIPTLDRRADDGAWSAWARVTTQIVTRMARVLLSAVRAPGDETDRTLVPPSRFDASVKALESARSVLADVEHKLTDLARARVRLDELTNEFTTRCLDRTKVVLARIRSDPSEIEREVTAASDAYQDALESILEDAALSMYDCGRRAHALRRPANESFVVPRVDPMLSELYDGIAPDKPLSTRLHETVDHAVTEGAGSKGQRGRRLGATIGMILGPIGAIAGSMMGRSLGALRAHQRIKTKLGPAVEKTVQAIVEQARPSVTAALLSIENELRGLELELWAQVDLLQSAEADRGSQPCDLVECSVFAPPSAGRGRSVLVLVFLQPVLHEMTPHHSATEDRPRTLAVTVRPDEQLAVHLSFSGGSISPASRTLTWRRRPEDLGFTVDIPDDVVPGPLAGTATVSVDGVPVAQMTFAVEISEGQLLGALADPRLASKTARHFEYAFLSHAYTDRPRAERWAQTLRRRRMPYCGDRVRWQPGQPWPEVTMRAIERCDLFILFWSKAAAESEWVTNEWQRALQRKRGVDTSSPAIIGVKVDDRSAVPPPDKLAQVPFMPSR